MSTWPKQSAVDAFYGNPRGKNGGPSAVWERDNLITIPCPWPLVTAWEPHQPVSRIRIHKKCADSLSRVLARTWELSGKNNDVIEALGLHLFGGSYMFRMMRGSNRLSMHSWGCAIDFDPARNGLGDDTPFLKPDSIIVAAFKCEGWAWGGDWSRKDAMHFQAAVV